MKLQRLQIKRYGRFDDFAIDFGEGFNQIIGDNDTGKSTLVRAIYSVLFENPAAVHWDGHQTNLSTVEAPYLLHLEYKANGMSYRLTKDIATETTMLEEIETGGKWNTPTDVQEQIGKALGFTEKELYIASSLVRQDDLAGVELAADLIRDKLEKMLSNSKDDLLVSRLLQRISNRLSQIQGKDDEPAGEILAIEKQISEWTNDLNSAKSKIVELLEARRRQETIGTELQAVQMAFEGKHDLFRKSKLALDAEQNLNQERDTYLEWGRRTKEAQESKNQITTKKEALKSLVKIERSDLRSAETLATQNQLLQGRLEDATILAGKEAESARSLQPRGWYRLLVGFALLSTVVSAFLWSKLHDFIYAGGAGIGLVVALITAVMWMTATATYKRALTRQKEAETRREEEEAKVYKGSEAVQDMLRRFSVKSVEEMGEKYEEYRDLDRDIKALVSRYETLLGNNNLKDMEVELAAMTARISQQQETFNKYRAYATTPEKLEQLQRELAELDRRLHQLQDENVNLENKLKFLEAGSDLMAPLQERIEEGDRQLRQLRTEAGTLSIVARYLEEARRRVLKSSIEILEDEASKILRGLTNDQWRRVKLDRHTLAAEITADGNNWMKSTSSLSRGTADALHLALRLALVKIISAETRPPIILEDPLLHFDQQRRDSAITVLRQFGEDYQILFFSTNRQYLDDADCTIDLNLTAALAESRSPVASN
jgi:DNA repair exonuclease SbcCD ATPase subunit